MRHVESLCSRIAAVLCLAMAPAYGQVSTTGLINGTVADPTGSAIAGAKISITNTATGAVSETIANSSGGFSQVGLTAGQYEIAMAHPGFNTFKETGISLESSASIP